MYNVRRGVAAAALFLFLAPVPGAVAEGPDAPVPTPPQRTAGEQEPGWQARKLERQYRQRAARLKRLRELAMEQGATERVAELDDLGRRVESMHAEKLAMLRDRIDPKDLELLDDDLADGRDPKQWAEFRQKMKEQAAAHRERMQQERGEFRDQMKEQDAQHRQEMKQQRGEFRDKMQEQDAEHRDQMKQLREEVRGKMQEQDAASREELKQQRGEFRDTMKEQNSAYRQEKQQQRGEFRDTMKEQNSAYRQGKQQQRGEFRDGMKQERGEFRDGMKDRREAEGRARAAERESAERTWSEARDRAGAEIPGWPREEAIKHRVSERFAEEGRRDREEHQRRAARRDGSMGDPRRPFHMPAQKDAEAAAGREITRDNFDAEFQRLRQEIDGR